MTDNELIAYFNDRPLPTGRITFSSFESTDDMANMVKLAIDRIENKAPGAEVSREALERLIAWLGKQD